MTAKARGILIFSGAEQESSINGNRMHIYYKLTIAEETKEQARKVCFKEFIADGHAIRASSVQKIN